MRSGFVRRAASATQSRSAAFVVVILLPYLPLAPRVQDPDPLRSFVKTTDYSVGERASRAVNERIGRQKKAPSQRAPQGEALCQTSTDARVRQPSARAKWACAP